MCCRWMERKKCSRHRNNDNARLPTSKSDENGNMKNDTSLSNLFVLTRYCNLQTDVSQHPLIYIISILSRPTFIYFYLRCYLIKLDGKMILKIAPIVFQKIANQIKTKTRWNIRIKAVNLIYTWNIFSIYIYSFSLTYSWCCYLNVYFVVIFIVLWNFWECTVLSLS